MNAQNRPDLIASADNDVRYVPRGKSDFDSVAHESRYTWMTEAFRLEGRTVLDFGCGAGYGSALLSGYASHVSAVDVSPQAVRYAQETYKADNLNFLCLDAADRQNLPTAFPAARFDFIASFDVIEHIEKYFDYLYNTAVLLKKDGILLIGCPNRLETFKWNTAWNPFHVQEFSPCQLKTLLSLFYEKVQMVSQDFADDLLRETVRKSRIRPRSKDLSIAARIAKKCKPKPRLPAIKLADMCFRINPDIEVLNRAFGILAICEKPRAVDFLPVLAND